MVVSVRGFACPPTMYGTQAMSYKSSRNVGYRVPTPLDPVHSIQPSPGIVSNPGYVEPLNATQRVPPVSRPKTPLTAIAEYGGYTLNDMPGSSGGGFGNPVF
ncbi:hypothetical protein PI124_g18485 [Phytophthora idaei]|nr:hypothetical protein PI125_g23515 [Phytophthora idaei]KAG3236511.1 hypothetical protein PI124_g18485 [Phytophthora idaei]